MYPDKAHLLFVLEIAQKQANLQGRLPPETYARIDRLTNRLMDGCDYFEKTSVEVSK